MSGPIVPAPIQTPPGSQDSALGIIKSAMRLIHVLAPGEEPPGPEANDALKLLNQMIDGWNAEQLMIYTTQIQDFDIDGTKQTYTLGIGGDFNVQRPAKISGTSIVLYANQSQPLEIVIQYVTDDQWQERFPIKTVPSTFPIAVYDDQAFPLRNLTFWPKLSDPSKFRMYSWGPLQQFNDLRASFSWPPGYLEALRYNLALALVDEWAGELGPTVVAGAIGSKARIKTANVTIETLKCDPAVNQIGQGSAKYKAEFFQIPSL